MYLGRINKDKGVIDLIEAFESLQESYKMFLILVGPMENDYIKEHINKNKKIYYIGKTLSPENGILWQIFFVYPAIEKDLVR